MLFSGWAAIGHTVLSGILAYAILLFLLRISGKRTLSKWNAFDLVVTVAFGSSLATALLSRDTSVTQVATAFGLLVLVQFAVTWTSVRSHRFEAWIKAEPRLLVRDGQMLREAMRAERVTEEEVHAAMRSAGAGGLDRIAALTLETDGSFSVVLLDEVGEGDAIRPLRGWRP